MLVAVKAVGSAHGRTGLQLVTNVANVSPAAPVNQVLTAIEATFCPIGSRRSKPCSKG